MQKTNNITKEIQNWNYNKSVEKMKTVIYRWKNLTVDMVRELYLAREALDGRQGTGSNQYQRKEQKLKNLSFSDYCDDISITYFTARNWLKRYIPEKNKLLTYDEFKEIEEKKKPKPKLPPVEPYLTEKEADAARQRTKEFMKNKEGSVQDDIDEINKSTEEIKHLLNDLTEENQEKEERRKQFKLSSKEENIDQEILFDSIQDFLNQTKDINRRLEIIQNCIKFLKKLAIECQRKTIK